MNHLTPRQQGWRLGAVSVALAALLAIATPAANAGRNEPFEARGGLDIAIAGAMAWSPDAYLVYVENDEDPDARGAAERWGYLFYSPSLEKTRAYSIRNGKILVAEPLDMKFVSPPLAAHWIDSGAALAAADARAGRVFRSETKGVASTMLLMRGAFHDGDPDRTTWTIVYTAPDVPALFVVVDAEDGKVRRTWRG